MFKDIDWNAFLFPDVPLVEIILRGSVMYIGLFILLRIVLRRQSGSLGMTDLLLITLLADASQNGMAGEYRSVPDGLVLVATIIAWNAFLDWLEFTFPWFERLIEPPPLPLIRNGRLILRNLKREKINVSELKGQLREKGIDDMESIKVAYIESNGHISVIKKRTQ